MPEAELIVKYTIGRPYLSRVASLDPIRKSQVWIVTEDLHTMTLVDEAPQTHELVRTERSTVPKGTNGRLFRH